MKKYCLVLILLLSFLLVGCKKDNFENRIILQGKFYEDYVAGQYEVIDNYDKYKEIFNNVFDELENKLEEKDFKDNKYIVFKMYYDYCNMNDVVVNDYSFKDDIVTVKVKYTLACSSCIEMDNYDYYLLKIPKSLDVKDVKLEEDVTISEKCKDMEEE